jgi:hypothetical protein
MRRHSAGDASRLAALLLPHILPIFSVVAPCQAGASPPSVLRRIYEMSSSAVLCAYNVKKGNFQSAAEAFAKHFKDDYLQKR